MSELTKSTEAHWFYKSNYCSQEKWYPFCQSDSDRIERIYKKLDNKKLISTNGGRYDVSVEKRIRSSVYWEETPSPIRRGTWFYKGENGLIPYSEESAFKLEQAYQQGVLEESWLRKIDVDNDEVVILYSSKIFAHYQSDYPFTEDIHSFNDNHVRTCSVFRGPQELKIDKDEVDQVDHLVFVVHGVGKVCDLRFRTIMEVVDDLRSISQSLYESHFSDEGKTGRIEFLPISWHSSLHSENTGIDNRLKLITLPSIPKLRSFSNDTILDVLFYTTPVYMQNIVDAVCSELNRVYNLFIERNPSFNGKIALLGHSLGSLIIFDLLLNQENDNCRSHLRQTNDISAFLKYLNMEQYVDLFTESKINVQSLMRMNKKDLKELKIPLGDRIKLWEQIKIIKMKDKIDENISEYDFISKNYFTSSICDSSHKSITYPQLDFKPICFFAIGSPIAMFLIVRGIETIKENFHLPTCPYIFNIFHPYDPIAYRLEPLIDAQYEQIKPAQIPHHKGRKRMHLELKENLTKVGSDLKRLFLDPLKLTWNTIHQMATNNLSNLSKNISPSPSLTQVLTRTQSQMSVASMQDYTVINENIGRLNNGQRIDYVLQEKPIEFFNEYVFALATHACYWNSEDTTLFIMKKVYDSDKA